MAKRPGADLRRHDQDAHDEALFEYYFASQLAAINIASGKKTVIGRPTDFQQRDALTERRIHFGFSHSSAVLAPDSHEWIPEDVEVWTRSGEVARKVAEVPSREGVPLNGVQTGPRGIKLAPGINPLT